VALYILNHKRAHLRDLERRFGVEIFVEADESLTGAVNHALERGEPARGVQAEPEPAQRPGYGAGPDDDFPVEETPEPEAEEEEVETVAEVEDETESEEEAEGAEATGEDGRRRRRRRRRRGERPAGEIVAADAPQPTDDGLAVVAEIGGDFNQAAAGSGEEARPNGLRRRRSRRGRRDRFGPRFGEAGQPETAEGEGGEETPTLPLYGDPLLGGIEASEDAPASIAEALEPPLPTEYAPAETHTPAPPVEAAPESRPEPVAEAAPEPEAASEPAPEPEPAADEPPRPRRTGWWSRAKSTLVGE
jgi:ribonuclease E